MRRILVGSILLGWIAFLAGVVMRGFGGAEHGLLHELQVMLIESSTFSLSFGVARGILTGLVVLTLTVALWALMFAVATEERERRERLNSLGAAFSCVFLASAFLVIVAAIAGAPQVIAMLFAIQMATLLSMIAAGGVEIAWERAMTASAVAKSEARPERRVPASFFTAGAGISAFGPPANDPEPR